MTQHSNCRLTRNLFSFSLGCLVVLAMATQPVSAQDTNDGDDGPGTSAPTGGRQPIIQNQFTTTSGGALQIRRPGLYIQQGIAVQNGQGNFSGVPEEELGWVRETADNIALDFINVFTDLFGMLDTLIGSINPGSGSAAFVPISNAATTGQGTSVPIS